MKKTILGLVAIGALIAGPAMAADLGTRMPVKAPPAPLEPVFSWTGFYIGGNIGWGWLNDEGNPFCITPGGILNGPGCLTNTVPGAHIRGDGFIGGGQLGYNWQSSTFVFGIEADIQGADIHGSFTGSPLGGGTFVANEKLSWLGTVRPRVGFLVTPQALLYATGGLAYGGGSVSQNTIFPGVQFPSSATFTKAGWTAGGGLEWRFPASNWSAKLEGLYYDLGSVTTSGGSVPVGFNGFIGGKVFDVRGAIARVGLDYHFGGPIATRY